MGLGGYAYGAAGRLPADAETTRQDGHWHLIDKAELDLGALLVAADSARVSRPSRHTVFSWHAPNANTGASIEHMENIWPSVNCLLTPLLTFMPYFDKTIIISIG